jgi:hypothetical protein
VKSRFLRGTAVSTAFLAGLIAGILTIALDSLSARQAFPIYVAVPFREVFIGGIFGVVVALYCWLVRGAKSGSRTIGFIIGSIIAYDAAWWTTFCSAEFLGISRKLPDYSGTIAEMPISPFVLGGMVGAFIVLLSAMLFFSSERKISRILLLPLLLSAWGGILGALGWFAGPSLGRLLWSIMGEKSFYPSPNDADSAYSYSIFLVWQTGIALAIGLTMSSRTWRPLNAESSLPESDSPHFATILRRSFLTVAFVALVAYTYLSFPSLRTIKWHRGYSQHLAETPPADNLPEVRPEPPDQKLVLRQFGDYIPGRTVSGKTNPAPDVKTGKPRTPRAQAYGVSYALPGAPEGGPNVGPHVDVQVEQYPNAAWAKYEILEQGFGIDLGNPARPEKFGYRLYGQAEPTRNGQNGFYLWSSNDYLVILRFSSADPDEFLKAYLEKFPSSDNTF